MSLKRKEKFAKEIDDLNARIAKKNEKGTSTVRLSARLSRRVAQKAALKAKIKAKG
jgi:hypothetical protein